MTQGYRTPVGRSRRLDMNWLNFRMPRSRGFCSADRRAGVRSRYACPRRGVVRGPGATCNAPGPRATPQIPATSRLLGRLAGSRPRPAPRRGRSIPRGASFVAPGPRATPRGHGPRPKSRPPPGCWATSRLLGHLAGSRPPAARGRGRGISPRGASFVAPGPGATPRGHGPRPKSRPPPGCWAASRGRGRPPRGAEAAASSPTACRSWPRGHEQRPGATGHAPNPGRLPAAGPHRGVRGGKPPPRTHEHAPNPARRRPAPTTRPATSSPPDTTTPPRPRRGTGASNGCREPGATAGWGLSRGRGRRSVAADGRCAWPNARPGRGAGR